MGVAGHPSPMAGYYPELASTQASRATPQTTALSGDGPAEISEDERRQMIATAAYYRAERRAFTGGSPDRDWLEAEAEVDQALRRRSV